MLQGRVTFGGALSGRDQNAVNKTISGLLKLIHPSPDEPVPDEDLEWAVRLALECRRRVKEQQKRIGTAEFRNTQFSYTLGKDGVEKFVVTPELQSEDHIGRDPLPPGQVWAISPGGQDEGSGPVPHRSHRRAGRRRPHPEPARAPGVRRERQVRRSRTCTPGPRNWSATATRANTSSRSSLRAFDASKSGSSLGVAALLAMCSALHQQEPAGRPGGRRRPQPGRLASTRCTTPSTWWNWPSRRAPRSS